MEAVEALSEIASDAPRLTVGGSKPLFMTRKE